MTRSAKAELRRRLHHWPSILRIVNAWDTASARIVERTGFPAAATGRAGVAFSLGYRDGEALPRGKMLGQAAASRVCLGACRIHRSRACGSRRGGPQPAQ